MSSRKSIKIPIQRILSYEELGITASDVENPSFFLEGVGEFPASTSLCFFDSDSKQVEHALVLTMLEKNSKNHDFVVIFDTNTERFVSVSRSDLADFKNSLPSSTIYVKDGIICRRGYDIPYSVWNAL